MPVNFTDFLQFAYWEPLPKRFFAVFLILAAYFILTRVFDMKWIHHLSPKVSLTAILVLALILRVGWCIMSPTVFAPHYGDPQSVMDESTLINIHSVQISQAGIPLNEDGTLATRRPVGYLYLLGSLYRVFGYHKDLFKWVQIALDCLLVFIGFILARSIFRNQAIAILLALFFAIYPENVFAVHIPLDEYPFFVFWLLSLFFIAENIRRKAVKRTILISTLLGIATAFRTNSYFMPLILCVAYVVSGLSLKKGIFQMVVSFLMIYFISAPWGWTTYRHYGSPSFFATSGIYFYGTLNDRAQWHNGYLPQSIEDGGDPKIIYEKNPVRQAQIATQRAIEWVIHHPVKAFQWFLMRNAVLYGFDLANEISDLSYAHAEHNSSWAIQHHHSIRKIKNWAYSFSVISGLIGTVVLFFDRRHLFWLRYPAFILLILILIYWSIVHGFFFGFKKYRWAIDLLMLFPTSFLFWWLAELPFLKLSNQPFSAR